MHVCHDRSPAVFCPCMHLDRMWQPYYSVWMAAIFCLSIIFFVKIIILQLVFCLFVVFGVLFVFYLFVCLFVCLFLPAN